MRWAENVARMESKRNACRLMVGKPERKRLLGRPGRRWEDNIKTELRRKKWGGMNWIDVTRIGPGGYGNELSGSTKFWEVDK
jgi:hypothetical protein